MSRSKKIHDGDQPVDDNLKGVNGDNKDISSGKQKSSVGVTLDNGDVKGPGYISSEETLVTRGAGLLIAGLGSNGTGLNIALRHLKETTQRTIAPSSPDIELLNAMLAKRELIRNLSNVTLPLETGETFNKTVLGRLLSSKDLSAMAAKALTSMVTNAASQYFLTIEERRTYVDAAMEALQNEHTMDPAEWTNLRKEIDTIITDGYKRSFRDGFGRSLPIPEATGLARAVESATSRLGEALDNNDIIGNADGLIELITRYSKLEHRSRFAVTEVEKDMVAREISDIIDRANEFPVVGALVLNRFLFTSRGGSHPMTLPRFVVAPHLGATQMNIDLASKSAVRGPVKVLKFVPRAILSGNAEAALQFTSAKELITYVAEHLNYKHVPSESDMIAEALGFKYDIDRLKSILNIKDPKTSDISVKAALDELFEMLFVEKLVDTVLDSFTTVPSFNSQVLNTIRASAADEESIKSLEPFIIALDNIKTVYYLALQELVTLLRPRLVADIHPNFIKMMVDQMDRDHSFNALYNSDQQGWFVKLLTMFEGLVAHSAPSRVSHLLPNLGDVDASWSHSVRVKSPGQEVRIIMKDIIASATVEASDARLQRAMLADLPDDVIMVVNSAESGQFSVTPYAKYDVSFGSSMINDALSHMPLKDYERLLQNLKAKGLPLPGDINPVMLDPTSEPMDYVICKLLRLGVSKPHWVVKIKPEIFIVPSFTNSLIIEEHAGNSGEGVTLSSPWLSLHVMDNSLERFDLKQLPFKGKQSSKVSIVPEVWPLLQYSYKVSDRLVVRAPKIEVDLKGSAFSEGVSKQLTQLQDELTKLTIAIPGLIKEAIKPDVIE